MLLNFAIHTSLIQKRSSHSYQSKHHMSFNGFLWLRITIVALVLQLIWYYSSSWVSNIGDLVLILIFWCRIIKCGWFFMMGIIASNFLRIGNGSAIVVQYATTVVYVETHILPQFLENSRSHSNSYNLISSKKTHQLNGKEIDGSMENMPGITNGHQNYEKCECRDQCIKKNWKVKSKAADF